MNEYQQLEYDLSTCDLCKEVLKDRHIEPSVSDERVLPKPVVTSIAKKPVMVIGQAPGLTEYRTGKPFQGPAGKEIRDHFQEIGICNFDTVVFSSASAKCYPGRDPKKPSRDLPPSSVMLNNCGPLLQRQINLVDPVVIVLLGSTALKSYLKMSKQKASNARLDAYVGTSQDWDGRTIIFFPHTSGGSMWLNSYENKTLFKKAKLLLRNTLISKGIIAV